MYLRGAINADDSFSSNSQIFNKDYPTNAAVSDEKTQFPSLENFKSVKIENGYSGVLIPERTIDKAESYLEHIGVDKGILAYIKSLFPKTLKSLVKLIVKVGGIAVTAILVLLISSSIAVAFCSFSDLCSLKFGSLGWEKDGLEQSFRSFMTPEKMSFLGSFVHDAINKYSNLNKKKFRSVE